MKKIEAVIRPLKLDEVKIALGEIGVTGMSVSDVRGSGRPSPIGDSPRRSAGDMSMKIKIEVVARNEDVEEIVSVIERHARTGEPGDGKIFILPMQDAIRVRTEERGEAVL